MKTSSGQSQFFFECNGQSKCCVCLLGDGGNSSEQLCGDCAVILQQLRGGRCPPHSVFCLRGYRAGPAALHDHPPSLHHRSDLHQRPEEHGRPLRHRQPLYGCEPRPHLHIYTQRKCVRVCVCVCVCVRAAVFEGKLTCVLFLFLFF